MENYISNTSDKMFSERAKYIRKCDCGCSVIIYPTMKRDYVLCNWCHKKVFKDIEKQKEQDKKVQREEFRRKMWSLN